MLLPPREIAALDRLLDEDDAGYRFAVVPTSADPLTFVRAGGPLFGSAQFFSTPDGTAWAGLGSAWSCSTAGASRFDRLRSALRSFGKVPEPFRMLMGFSFSSDGPRTEEWRGFGGADLVLPELAVGCDGSETWLMAAVPPGADANSVVAVLEALDVPGELSAPDPGPHSASSLPAPAAWRLEVEEAVAAIRAGSLDKVVLGRSVVLESERRQAPFDLVGHLSVAYPQCFAFGWQNGDRVFVGASPELLLEKRDGELRLNPLAGSAARGEGEEEDERLGRGLMTSDKDLHEHRIVVEDIGARLEPLTKTLVVPAEPSLRRMATVQHLSTEITATIEPSASSFDLLDVLHPTPAVGGTPREAASSFIEKVEQVDRGWYSGGIGWVGLSGDCCVALSLRCGLVRNGSARLFAGAGIVADSDPESELVETRLKFRPLLELLSAT
ncbi:MAG: isochorismate synthase MenF [Acidimicrobiia bacterium]